MSIKTELESRKVVRPTVDLGSAYTAPGRPKILDTDFGKLGASLGGVVSDAFRFVGQQAEKNKAKGRELALLNPDENLTEVLRKNNIPSVFSNQVQRGWDIEQGDIAFSKSVALAKEEITQYSRENLDATPSDITDFIQSFYRDQTDGLAPTSKAIAIGRSLENMSTFTALGITQQAEARETHIIDTSAQKYEEIVKNGGDVTNAIQDSKKYWVGESKMLSEGEWQTMNAKAIERVMASPEYGADAAANMERYLEQSNPADLPVLLSKSRAYVNANLEQAATNKRRVKTDLVDAAVGAYIENRIPLTDEQVNELAGVDGLRSARSQIAAIEAGNSGGLPDGTFRSLHTSLQKGPERGGVKWSDVYGTDQWWSMSPQQRNTIKRDASILGHDSREQADSAETLAVRTAYSDSRVLLNSLINPDIAKPRLKNASEPGFFGYEKAMADVAPKNPEAQDEFDVLHTQVWQLYQMKEELDPEARPAQLMNEAVTEVYKQWEAPYLAQQQKAAELQAELDKIESELAPASDGVPEGMYIGEDGELYNDPVDPVEALAAGARAIGEAGKYVSSGVQSAAKSVVDGFNRQRAYTPGHTVWDKDGGTRFVPGGYNLDENGNPVIPSFTDSWNQADGLKILRTYQSQGGPFNARLKKSMQAFGEDVE